MAFWSGVKQMFGGAQRGIETLASAATVNVPEEGSVFYMSGTTAITSLICPKTMRGRLVTFIGTSAVGNVFTNTDGTTTEGQMELGGSDLTLGPTSVLQLYCKLSDGSWQLVNYRLNN